ncbi:MAG: leucine-rich repeat domain-containing protein [Chitinophagales bacterium]|nr:leucine-rich repeat domain-containing protein [Chitinophagales bacterium]
MDLHVADKYHRYMHFITRNLFILIFFVSIKALSQPAADSLGLSPKYPIKVGSGVNGGPRNERIYLKNLQDPSGRKIVYKRAGGCCQYELNEAPLGIATIDIYNIGYLDNDTVKDVRTLYLTYYEYERPVKAPYGFEFISKSIGDSLEVNETTVYKRYGNQSKVLLSFDKLKEVPMYIFNLSQIEELSIAYNELTEIPNEIGRLNRLKILEFQDNKIKTLPNSISTLDSLTEIYFCNNMNWELVFTVLSKCKNFKSAIFWNVGLDSLPSSITKCQNLERLNIKGNSKIDFGKAFDILSDLKNLKELTISFETSSMPNGINKVQSLEVLNIEHSEIKEMSNDVGRLRNLKELHFRYCDELTKIPRCINNCKKLSKVSLYSMRKPFDFDYSIQSLQGLDLTYLDLSQAWRIKIPKEIYNFKKLKFLGLNIYETDSIPDGIGNLTNLEEIVLSPADYKYMPADFGNLHSLKKIDLSGVFHINFESLFSILINLENLEEINIDYGEQRLPDSISRLKSIKRIIMTNYNREFVSPEERGRHKQLLPNCEFVY